jgi:hypothetical protein
MSHSRRNRPGTGERRHARGRASRRAWPSGTTCLILVALACSILGIGAAFGAAAAEELSYEEFQELVLAVHRLDKLALLEPPGDEVGMYLVLGDRYGLVHIFHMTYRKSKEIWKSKLLDGIVDEVITADFDGNGYDDAFIARTNAAMIYVWDAEDFNPLYESLSTDFEKVHAFTVGNVDDDPTWELIVNADRHIYFLDGKSYNREWTSPYEYEATRMLCGDVDGDQRNEIVLNTGQVLDTVNGDVEWEDEVFGSRIELLDIDGDGIPEVLSESDGTMLRIFDVDHKKEKFLQ